MSILLHVVAILACGLIGAVAGYAAIGALDWSGTGAAILAVAVGMVVAAGAWIAGVALHASWSRRAPGGGPEPRPPV